MINVCSISEAEKEGQIDLVTASRQLAILARD